MHDNQLINKSPWGGDKVMSVKPQVVISALIKETLEMSFALFMLWWHPQWTREWVFTNLLTILAPWSQTSSFQNAEKWVSVVHQTPSLRYFVTAAWMDWDISVSRLSRKEGMSFYPAQSLGLSNTDQCTFILVPLPWLNVPFLKPLRCLLTCVLLDPWSVF
jgi:hypothetical protein